MRPTSAARIGILGGTFDPPHAGHLEMARLARDRLALDEIVFTPVLSPSHKSEAAASFEDRLEMARLLVAGEPRMRVSGIEAGLGAKSYTVPMLAALRREVGPAADFYFVIGADSLAQFHLWYQYPEILRLATVVAISRPGYPLENPRLTAAERARVIALSGLDSPLASRAIREGTQPDLPPRLEVYIRRRGLYGKRP